MSDVVIVDGRALAGEVLARAKARAEELGRVPVLAIIAASAAPATRSYLAIKERKAAEAGCAVEIVRLPEDAGTAELADAARREAARADAVVIQLPLSQSVDTQAVLDAVPAARDADVLSTVARTAFEQGSVDALLPPVVGAVREILGTRQVLAKGMPATVVGAGRLVGAPVAAWLRQQGAAVTVVDVSTPAEEMRAALRAARLIISGAGVPRLITPDLLTPGVALIDAGTAESSGKIVGDADPACADRCSLFTPVPGGVGPLTVAALFDNVVTLATAPHA